MLNFSKIIQTPLFEKWYLYNAKKKLGPKFLYWKPNISGIEFVMIMIH